MDATFNEQWGVVRAVHISKKKKKKKKMKTPPSGMCALKRNSRWCNEKNSFGTFDSNWFSLKAWSLDLRDFSCHLFIKTFQCTVDYLFMLPCRFRLICSFRAMLSVLVPSEFTGLLTFVFLRSIEWDEWKGRIGEHEFMFANYKRRSKDCMNISLVHWLFLALNHDLVICSAFSVFIHEGS